MDSDYYAVEDDGHFCEVCRLPVFIVFTWASLGRGLPGAWPRGSMRQRPYRAW
jgi:hypothetical protein